MPELDHERILTMFRDMGLESDEKRSQFRRFEETRSSEIMPTFIRLGSTTTPTQSRSDA